MKKEFRRRLVALQREIECALDSDSCAYGLLPALYSVFTYMWCKSVFDLSKRGK